jgi:catechol 2,3-dioxygenase-like lactoylglutathione lyase family enzyme
MKAHLRVARPTDHLQAIAAMYQRGLGLQVLAHFEDHAGFDGIMLGDETMPYHFEFTQQRGHVAGRAPTQDNLVVFYIPDAAEWTLRSEAMVTAGFKLVPSYNPYWDKAGKTFEDLDGYRVVLQNAAWD